MRTPLLALALLTIAALLPAQAQPTADQPKPMAPNFVVIVVDDAAMMDFGVTGGEALTPNIDALAARGALFTNYHTSPLCSPSRSMLLTGIDNHRTGHATIEEVLPPEQRGKPGYSLRLEPGVQTVAVRLKAAGYRTYMTGKWHLGRDTGDLPNSHGFDRSFVLDASGADNWEQKPYMPYYDIAPWFEDGKPAKLPEKFYSSEFLVDQMLKYLDTDATATTPFFAYVAFQAVHIPVQAPREFTAHYAGKFDQGWEVLRAARWSRAKQLGLISADAPLADLPPELRKWSALTPDEQRLFSKSMEVYAGMLESMDHNIGRLIDHLKSTGKFDNTIFVITSDNGPEPSDPVHAAGMNIWMGLHGYNWSLENLGEKGSLAFIGPEWAASISSPSRLFKFYTTEGGLRVPLIMSGPGVTTNKHASAAFVTDITPTILDFAGVDPSGPQGSMAMTGATLRAVLDGKSDRTHDIDKSVGIEVAGNAALYKGDYKIMRNGGKFGSGDKWQLFNVVNDPSETRDLSAAEPERLRAMIEDYKNYAKTMGVLDLPAGYSVQRQVLVNALTKQFTLYWWVLALIGVLFVGLIVMIWRFFRRRT